jgi:hypothetical protein
LEQRRRFGYMPEERGLYPDMRVRDQLVYFARLSGVGADDAGRRTDGLLERLRPDGPGGGGGIASGQSGAIRGYCDNSHVRHPRVHERQVSGLA